MKIGIDIEEVKRFSKNIKNKSFVERVFSQDEIAYCSKFKKNAVQHYAVRFAGKEAVWKALDNDKITINSISFKNLPSGKPEVYVCGKKKKNIKVSFSHTENTVVAVAIAE